MSEDYHPKKDRSEFADSRGMVGGMQNVRRSFQSMTRYVIASLLCFVAFRTAAGASVGSVPMIPAGTRLKFHVTQTISSSASKTGETFGFALLEPIALADRSIAVEGTTGAGTIYLAGHAGPSGHEGDLTLRLDSLTTADGLTYAFVDARFHIDGRNRKVTSNVIGLIPFVGFGGRLIRGSDARIDLSTPIETVLERPALSIAGATFTAIPDPIPSRQPR